MVDFLSPWRNITTFNQAPKKLIWAWKKKRKQWTSGWRSLGLPLDLAGQIFKGADAHMDGGGIMLPGGLCGRIHGGRPSHDFKRDSHPWQSEGPAREGEEAAYPDSPLFGGSLDLVHR